MNDQRSLKTATSLKQIKAVQNGVKVFKKTKTTILVQLVQHMA